MCYVLMPVHAVKVMCKLYSRVLDLISVLTPNISFINMNKLKFLKLIDIPALLL
jgi:hypothetical protein